jgi:toxin ParE1/3/4
VVGNARFVFAPGARRDLVGILTESEQRFGLLQQERYAILLRSAIDRVAQDPHCIGSKSREDLLVGLRSFHIGFVAHRRGSASHVLYYEERSTPDGQKLVAILRILHDRMDPELHIARDSDPT